MHNHLTKSLLLFMGLSIYLCKSATHALAQKSTTKILTRRNSLPDEKTLTHLHVQSSKITKEAHLHKFDQYFIGYVKNNYNNVNCDLRYSEKNIQLIVHQCIHFLQNFNEHPQKIKAFFSSYLAFLKEKTKLPVYLQQPLWLLIDRAHQDLSFNREYNSVFDIEPSVKITHQNYNLIAQELIQAKNLCHDNRMVYLDHTLFSRCTKSPISVVERAAMMNHKGMINLFMTLKLASQQEIFRALVAMNTPPLIVDIFFNELQEQLNFFTLHRDSDNYQITELLYHNYLAKKPTLDLMRWFLCSYPKDYYEQAELIWSNGLTILAEKSFEQMIAQGNYNGVCAPIIALIKKDKEALLFILSFYKNILKKKSYLVDLQKRMADGWWNTGLREGMSCYEAQYTRITRPAIMHKKILDLTWEHLFHHQSCLDVDFHDLYCKLHLSNDVDDVTFLESIKSSIEEIIKIE